MKSEAKRLLSLILSFALIATTFVNVTLFASADNNFRLEAETETNGFSSVSIYTGVGEDNYKSDFVGEISGDGYACLKSNGKITIGFEITKSGTYTFGMRAYSTGKVIKVDIADAGYSNEFAIANYKDFGYSWIDVTDTIQLEAGTYEIVLSCSENVYNVCVDYVEFIFADTESDTEIATDVETDIVTEEDTEVVTDVDTDIATDVETETKTYIIEIEDATVSSNITENAKGPDGASGGYYYIGEGGYAYVPFVPEYTGTYKFTVNAAANSSDKNAKFIVNIRGGETGAILFAQIDVIGNGNAEWVTYEIGTVELTAGETYFVGTKAGDGYNYSVDFFTATVEVPVADTDIETEVDTDIVTDVETEIETEVDTDIVTDVETDVETDTDVVIETDVETEVDTDTVIDTEVETDTDVVIETDVDTETKTYRKYCCQPILNDLMKYR